MPALAPSPLAIPRISPAASPQIELPSVSFFGRSLAEYAQFFALDLAALRGRDVLDVAGGPSSFTAEAAARKINAVAVDPLYGSSAEMLRAQIETDYDRMFAQIRAKPGLVRVGPAGPVATRNGRPYFFESIEAAKADRHAAAQRFLADYETHFLHNRYVAGALPRLPFLDGTFDLVLCAHLLFTYAQRFDFEWHLAACRELVRVSADEVRIHPLCGLDGRPYAGLARLRRELRAVGVESEVRALNYEFFIGATSMLVLRRAES